MRGRIGLGQDTGFFRQGFQNLHSCPVFVRDLGGRNPGEIKDDQKQRNAQGDGGIERIGLGLGIDFRPSGGQGAEKER